MRRKAFWALVTALLVSVAASALYAGWKCEVESSKKGSVGKPSSLTIDMGAVVFTDGDGGATAKVAWPTSYDHYNGTAFVGNRTRHQIVTPNGDFQLKLGVQLSGRKSWGVWSSKRNTVKVDVHKGGESGETVATKTVDRNVGSPSVTMIELPHVTAGLSTGDRQQYTVTLKYDKYDGNSSNDNECSCTITVSAN